MLVSREFGCGREARFFYGFGVEVELDLALLRGALLNTSRKAVRWPKAESMLAFPERENVKI